MLQKTTKEFPAPQFVVIEKASFNYFRLEFFYETAVNI